MFLTDTQLARIAHEAWIGRLPQRERTAAHLTLYLMSYAEATYGPCVRWSPDVREHVDRSRVLALQMVKPWQLAPIGA